MTQQKKRNEMRICTTFKWKKKKAEQQPQKKKVCVFFSFFERIQVYKYTYNIHTHINIYIKYLHLEPPPTHPPLFVTKKKSRWISSICYIHLKGHIHQTPINITPWKPARKHRGGGSCHNIAPVTSAFDQHRHALRKTNMGEPPQYSGLLPLLLHFSCFKSWAQVFVCLYVSSSLFHSCGFHHHLLLPSHLKTCDFVRRVSARTPGTQGSSVNFWLEEKK